LSYNIPRYRRRRDRKQGNEQALQTLQSGIIYAWLFQATETVKEVITSSLCPDVLLIQEHWLTPSNISLFSENISTHYAFGVSFMADRLTRGPLVGRPCGGVSVLINNELHTVTECVFCTERYVVIRVGTVVIINVYLPCKGQRSMQTQKRLRNTSIYYRVLCID